MPNLVLFQGLQVSGIESRFNCTVGKIKQLLQAIFNFCSMEHHLVLFGGIFGSFPSPTLVVLGIYVCSFTSLFVTLCLVFREKTMVREKEFSSTA